MKETIGYTVRLLRLFGALTLLVALAAWMADLLFGLLSDLRPFGFDDLTHDVVKIGMIVIVAIVGWRMAQRL